MSGGGARGRGWIGDQGLGTGAVIAVALEAGYGGDEEVGSVWVLGKKWWTDDGVVAMLDNAGEGGRWRALMEGWEGGG